MTIFDQVRLTNETFRLDIEGLRHGYYSDKYFANVVTILEGLRSEVYTYNGENAREVPINPHLVAIGDIEVEAQIFNRRLPYALVGGIDVALSMIRHCTGYYAGDEFVSTWRDLEVVAVQDGVVTHYGGDPNDVHTVIEIRGCYRDFALLETPILGVLTRASRIATNVYNVLKVCNGKPVLFFPARFDLPEVQSLDGYAYWLAVQRYNHDTGQQMSPLVSTDAQGAWWGGEGGGTVPHAIVACFFADTAESMLAFARHIPPSVPRIALVDFNNDTVRDSLLTLDAMWPHYRDALAAGDEEGQRRYTLNAVRLDTSGALVDASLNRKDPRGVSPLLVRTVRRAMDNAWTRWGVPAAQEDVAKSYCQNVGIVVSGGFNREKIARFEAENTPVDYYGVGSTFLRNDSESGTDFTMDVVRLKIDGQWITMAKVGRSPGDNIDLKLVDLSGL
jgi:nicotinate phosphoribosyltransferase